jgi:mevalonate kinase
LLFQAGRVQELGVGRPGTLVIADSGVVGRTKDMVERLRHEFGRTAGAREAFVRTATELTGSARHALADGRLADLGARLTDYHELLRVAGVSTDGCDALVRTALTGGCLGAKITGGGGGGCVIALTPPERTAAVVRRLYEAGAARTWVISLGGRGDDAL